MYDRNGKFQDLDPVSSEGLDVKSINPIEQNREFDVTKVADSEGAERIAKEVIRKESERFGGLAHVDYSLEPEDALTAYQEAPKVASKLRMLKKNGQWIWKPGKIDFRREQGEERIPLRNYGISFGEEAGRGARFSVVGDEAYKEAARERIDERLAQVRRGAQSLKSNVGNFDGMHSTDGATLPNGYGDQSVAHLDNAKVNKKFESASDLTVKVADFVGRVESGDVSAESFPQKFVEAIGRENRNQRSKYIHYISVDENKVTLRLSDHSGVARNIIINGVRTDKGLSIVLDVDGSNNTKFKANNWAMAGS